MAKKPQAKTTEFAETIELLANTLKGQEASMYGPLRDLICNTLGYARGRVLIDIAGDAGRPDLTCRAPCGLTDRQGRSIDIDWIVVEAKDERNAFLTEAKREVVFAHKAKYITPNTAWFVMVDPTVFVARPVHSADLSTLNDIVFRLDGSEDETVFRTKFARLAADVAGVPERLKAFREGDTSQIATEKLGAKPGSTLRLENQVALARRNFYSSLRDTTQALQDATLDSLRRIQPRLIEIQADAAAFSAKYGACHFDPYTVTVRGEPSSYELTKTHARDAARLSRKLKHSSSLARLALAGLPLFRARVSSNSDEQVLEMFATETANLVLARILLIRFFEDHRFFGANRYLCNGGVKAFQQFRQAFDHGYTRLLKMAYEKAQHLFAAAFDETELDWVFDMNDPGLSAAIEWAMYQLSRYDFTTVRGDILTGIYDRFLDREQRKKFGEYYTPPSIARYIVDALNLNSNDRFLDPSCGSGTFLIERYQQVIGEDADRGLATYAQAVEALEKIAGNDINTFSAVLAQIQLLWHVLSFRDDLLKGESFPDIAISDKANSLVNVSVEASIQTRFFEVDRPDYGGVGGNPPYVRPERSGKLDAATVAYFENGRSMPGNVGHWNGVSAEANLYALFVYRALNSWCRQPDRWGAGAGKLGYVVPLAFCGTRENADLRRLFAPGGRWTIREIVDLEVIWRHIFDADVLPIVLIAEARSPILPLDRKLLAPNAKLPEDPKIHLQVRATRLHYWMEKRRDWAAASGDKQHLSAWDALITRNRTRWEPDRVAIRLADKGCIDFQDGTKRPVFRLSDIQPAQVDYEDLFSPDGRILTRLNPERRAIIGKLQKNGTLADAFRVYWYKKSGENRGSVQLSAPTLHALHWERREMVSRGIVYAGKKRVTTTGQRHTVYKAENILAGAIYGEPQDVNIDISAARNRYLFDHLEVLPERMWAVAMIATCPNAVRFDPRRIAFTDTATIFGPRDDLADMPFDLLFLSRVYRYYYALACRMSYLNMNRSHVYPANLRLLPWNDALAKCIKNLEALRTSINTACEVAFQTEAAMFDALGKLPTAALRDAVRTAGGKIVWSDSFLKAAEKIEVSETVHCTASEEGWRVQVSSYLFDWLEITSEDLARGLVSALKARSKSLVDREAILAMAIPTNATAKAEYDKTVSRFATADHLADIESVVDKIDQIVGPSLGLSKVDIAAIKRDMAQDPFLKNIQPRYPSTETRLHGYRTGLDSAERYE